MRSHLRHPAAQPPLINYSSFRNFCAQRNRLGGVHHADRGEHDGAGYRSVWSSQEAAGGHPYAAGERGSLQQHAQQQLLAEFLVAAILRQCGPRRRAPSLQSVVIHPHTPTSHHRHPFIYLLSHNQWVFFACMNRLVVVG